MDKQVNKTNDANCFTNRELSWLQFNERCLNEAGNPAVPLAERLTFASIFQTNLDEFFMVRVGSIMDQRDADPDYRENKTNMTSSEQISAILRRVKALEKKKAKIYEQLMGELEPKGIRIINFNKLSKQEGELLEKYFDKNIAPYLSPMVISKAQPFPFLNNKELYAMVMLKNRNDKQRIGIVPCTNSVFKRLIEIPSRPGNFMLSEELILHFASKLYRKYEVLEKTIIRVTRNADIDTEEAYDEELEYREAMEHLIKQRKRLNPVRIELSRELSKGARADLSKLLKTGLSHVIKVDTPLDLKFVFQLQDYLRNKPELFFDKRSPRQSCQLNAKEKLIPQIEKKDVLLSYPFNDMKAFIRLLHEAAEDDSVVSIKMTLYRVAERSKIIEALVEAAENGKEVDVLIELRARFDEENNIEMSRRLEYAGCNVIYGLPGLKVHSKLCLITRKINGEVSYITQIGTGNYNEKTSKLYTDLSLITANQDIGAEGAKVFGALLMGETVQDMNHLFVAPNCLQNRILEMMDDEIKKAKDGKEGYIGAKINSLTDKKIIKKLIEASKAGVKIELIVRGICCLKPGIPEQTDNITIISIVGRYLEHSRIYRFGKGEEEKIYIASADFMTRNTVRRVEIGVPIYDEGIKNRIRHIFDTGMLDDEKGKMQSREGLYVDRDLHHEGGKLNSQEIFFREAYEEAEKAGITATD
ncbi:MAG: polyphosphate kinase 1 [Clostridia bacterium]|nr:polyphosphate kinase 1 [Clostridia bacterium]